MLTIRRLNMDSSWHIAMGNTSFIVDPWLLGSEIDGFKWLNEQWHVVDPVPIDELPDYDFIVITQSYEDHCHIDTLEAIPANTPILATAKAYKRLTKRFPARKILHIPNAPNSLEFSGLTFEGFRPDKLLDPVYFSIAVTDNENKTIFYAPHGFTLKNSQLRNLHHRDVELLITTFTDFRLPAVLGGHVNPGEENAALLCRQLNPRTVVHTHDEQKKMKGLVARYAKVAYPDYSELAGNEAYNFVEIRDYSPFVVSK